MANRTNSGVRREVFNLRERAISDDFNRAQAFLAATLAQLARRTHLASTLGAEAGGKSAVPSTTGNPLAAVVFEGLRFRPEIGTVNAFVEPGAALVVMPDASPHPDDDPGRLVLDPGVSVAGELVLTPGAVATRIDVVECQPTTVVVESDSRDRFNPSTGLFTPVTVNKVVRGALSYRIRSGTPGAGFPGTASGWLPIAVCSIPSSATSWDAVVVWDVRPLLADLLAGHRLAAPFPAARRRHVVAVEPTDAVGQWRASGIVETEIGGWRAGGDLAPSISGLSYLRLDGLDATLSVQEPAFAVTADRPWYLYLAQPYGLPRWARYTPSSVGGERRPAEPRGIPIFSQKAPSGMTGAPSSALALPTATGLGGTTSTAVVAAAGMFDGSNWVGNTTGGGGTDSFLITSGVAPSSGAGTQSVVYTLTGAVHFPVPITAIRLQFEMKIAAAGGTVVAFDRDVQVKNAGATEVYSAARLTGTATVPAGGDFYDRFEVWLELPPTLPSGAAPVLRVEVDYAVSGTLTDQRCYVKGWRLA